jgi:cardiolipin synthase A/B
MILTFEIVVGVALAAVGFVVSLVASSHVVLYKRDSRSAIAWTGLIWLAPFVGTLLYVLLGINRIERRARTLRPDTTSGSRPASIDQNPTITLASDVSSSLAQLSRLIGRVTGQELTRGNTVEPLSGGDEAYPAMLAAIAAAQRTIGLSTYIFDADNLGMEFAKTLAAASERGVEVRVLIDAVGASYALSSIVATLEELGVRVETYNPPLLPGRFRYANLRNHRKILTIDGQIAFTGGMNIRGCCATSDDCPASEDDLHFRLGGPIVRHVQDTFTADWSFAANEELVGAGWYSELKPLGECAARGIVAGPDEQFDRLNLTLLGACQCARRSLRIVTPYFLPEASLISALNVAALRGVTVEILLPGHGNQKLVQWACDAQLWQLVTQGCEVRKTPRPFDHSKLVIVDDEWVLMGSSNWDPRSLRLNFEFNVECYGRELAEKLKEIFEAKKAKSKLVTIDQLEARSLPVKLRDGVARLAIPFL